MKRRGLSFAELLIALAILALVICGSMIFLQTNLMWYRRQISAVRGSFLGQDLLRRFPLAAGPAHGQIEDFEYAVEVQSTAKPVGAWLNLTLSQGRNTLLRQSLWRPAQLRKIAFQAFDSGEWSQIEADGPGQLQGPLPAAEPSTDGHAIFWKGRSLFHSDALVLSPRANAPATRIAFLLLQGTDRQLWTLEVDSKRAECWLRDVQSTDPPGWLSADTVLICRAGRQLLRVSASGQQVLYEGNGLSAPSLSPDGIHIAFISHPQDNNDIFVLDTATRKASNITHSDPGEIRPLWSAQGDRILFGVAPLAGGFPLSCINPDGTGRQQLNVTASGNDWHWSPSIP